MKRILFTLLAFSLFLFFSCQKDHAPKTDYNLQYVKTIPGGCAVDILNQNARVNEPDTVIWHISNDTLSIMVGFNNECCMNFKTESNISNDTIYMNITWIPGPMCSCICYYTYDFLFTGINQPYYYLVTFPNGQTMSGYIKP